MKAKTLRYRNLAEKAAGMRAIIIRASVCEAFRKHVYNLARSLNLKNLQLANPLLIIEAAAEPFIYVNDPHVELYQYPLIFGRLPLGDCDDITLYLASILQVLRVPNEMIFRFDNDELTHVYIHARINNQCIGIDYARHPPNIWIASDFTAPAASFNEETTALYLRSVR